MQEFDEGVNLLKEKKELSEGEKAIYEKRAAYYERHYEGQHPQLRN